MQECQEADSELFVILQKIVKRTHIRKDVVVLGAGAAGLMCAIEAAKRGRLVLLLEQSESIGQKIRISGGGRCNFTNLIVDNNSFLSDNPHFCKSALSRYTPSDFISLVERHGIAYHEKTRGQLFCDGSAQQIISMLQKECKMHGVEIIAHCRAQSVSKGENFTIETNVGRMESASLVIATGGLSIPKLGATDFGYSIAKTFGLRIVRPRPGLVPLLWNPDDLKLFSGLSGISVPAIVGYNKKKFEEAILFTHRGLSGPAILQISSYWKSGEAVSIDLLPHFDMGTFLQNVRDRKLSIVTLLSQHLPKRFVEHWVGGVKITPRPMNQFSPKELMAISERLHGWEIFPSGTEGYAKAEVTVGGIDTNELSSKTMEAKRVPGLYFIGEVVDVTGHLGGYNFQWAWSSGFAAGQYV